MWAGTSLGNSVTTHEGGAATVSAEIVAASVPIVKVPDGTQTCPIPAWSVRAWPGLEPGSEDDGADVAVPADADEAGAVAVTVGAAVSDGVRDPVGDDPAGADVVEPPSSLRGPRRGKAPPDGRSRLGRGRCMA